VELVRSKAAVLGLHWQVNVVKAEGFFGAWFAEPVAASGVIGRAAAAHAAARAAGLPVVFTRFTIPADGGLLVGNTPLMQTIAGNAAFLPDSPGSQVIAELGPEPGDRVVDNQRLSGLAGNDLADWLRVRGIDTVVLTGVATNLTVEQTARSGTDLGFHVYVLGDCVTTADPAVHEASLANLNLATRGVIDSAELLAALG